MISVLVAIGLGWSPHPVGVKSLMPSVGYASLRSGSRASRLLALAHKFQGMLDRGEVESMAELARLGRVSRARITQIMDLLMLAPDIQGAVLFGDVVVRMRELVSVGGAVEWINQRKRLQRLLEADKIRPAA